MKTLSWTWAWILAIVIVLCAAITQIVATALGAFPRSFSDALVAKWKIAESEEPQPPAILGLLTDSFSSPQASQSSQTSNTFQPIAPGPSIGYEYPEMTIYPLDAPLWTFGADASYDSGGAPVKQLPQPADPTATTPRNDPSGASYATTLSDTLDVTPEPNGDLSGGAAFPQISTPAITGSNTMFEGNQCKYSANSGYLCEPFL